MTPTPRHHSTLTITSSACLCLCLCLLISRAGEDSEGTGGLASAARQPSFPPSARNIYCVVLQLQRVESSQEAITSGTATGVAAVLWVLLPPVPATVVDRAIACRRGEGRVELIKRGLRCRLALGAMMDNATASSVDFPVHLFCFLVSLIITVRVLRSERVAIPNNMCINVVCV